jgi:flavodoxin
MRALVVYGAPYENTRVVAGHVAEGLRATHKVTVVPAAGATADLLAETDLLVVGGPTHVRGLSSGIHDVFKGLKGWPELAAAFDTKISGGPADPGRSSRGIARLLKRHGYLVIVGPESFGVTAHGTPLDGEPARARHWGAALGIISTVAHAA